MRWFVEARFGMFIHWGLYSLAARGEWMMHQEHIPNDEYALLAKQFNPQHYDPRDWVRVAQDAGMKYMVLTTRHHDGFCLWDSKVSAFSSAKTAAKRDLVAEYAEACHAAGMRMGLYYSLIDWRFPGAMRPMGEPVPPGTDFSAMVEQAHAQVRELMTGYGKVDILWYDGPWPSGIWRSDELNAMACQLQPGIVINDRSDTPGDYGTPEGHIAPESRPWESCMMIGDTWGYNSGDRNNKTPCQILHILLSCVAQGGNLLLNVSPDGDGRIPRDQLDILRPVGDWIRRHSEVIYGGGRSTFSAPGLGWTLAAHGKEYLIPHRWHGSSLTFGWCRKKAKSARVVSTGQIARVEQKDDRVWIHGLPVHAPDPWANPIEIVFQEERS